MLELKQTQRLAQQLVLTPQLQQAIKLLQLSQLELVEAIEQEIKENPVLEVEEEQPDDAETQKKEEMLEWLERYSPSEDFTTREDKEYPDYENIVKKASNLRDYVRWQVGLSDFSKEERVWAEWIIENIDDNGYLASSLEEISEMSGIPAESLEIVLKKVQKLDPPGVGARDLKECLLLQYEDRGEKDEVFEDIVNNHFDLFKKMDLREVARKTGYSVDQVRAVFETIKSFDPKPGRNYESDQPIYVVPDVHVIKGEDGFDVFLNDEGVPDLRMNRYYVELFVSEKLNGDTKDYIKKKIKQAEWFMKSLQQRQRTLYLVAKSIVDFQREFFDKGIRCLKPLILKDVANYVGVHESTVSRITTNKYMGTPCGVFEMKFFFTTGVGSENGDAQSANAVMDCISEIVAKEDKGNPLKDEEIVALLKERFNVKIARRTVAKYREVLHIQSSRERRRLD
ncbi:MAG: RNA polymerase sigma-54 factor [Syntrophorhabdaceae bacterium PtaU1.Bin034]|jgi:RNA polymerase sigma-54 factor|nr:MAG: RNA polymerase sigma-54 factor [Syntrophorhabdaceae bacterium PtaU1.Bin034]